MSDSDAIDLALLLLRLGVGAVMLAHGIRHIFGGGKIAGTARWFGSMGMRAPLLQAWLASLTEIGAGVALVLGLLTPLGGAGVVGTMAVALIANHFKNGFFIFNKGEGYEYVMTLLLCGVVLGTVGPGSWSLDDALEINDDLTGTTGLLLSLVAGGAGALLLLAVFWRPVKPNGV
jgi:putative oxidoreductase